MAADSYTLRISSDVNELAAMRAFIEATCAKLGIDRDTVLDIMLAVNEAVTNIIVHGYTARSGVIDIEIDCLENRAIAVTLTDQADQFDPTAVPPPDLTLPLQLRPRGGMGVHMMRELMDTLEYHVMPDGRNRLTLVKQTTA